MLRSAIGAPRRGDYGRRRLLFRVQEAVDVNLTIRAYVDLPIGDDWDGKLYRQPGIIAAWILTAGIELLGDIAGIKRIKNRIAICLVASRHQGPHDTVCCAI